VSLPRVSRRVIAIAILLLALVVRIAYVEATPYHAVNDAGTYNRMASMVATHGDYHTGSGPRTGAGNSRGPTAYFPPGFPYTLALADLLTGHAAGGKSALHSIRIEQALLGTLAVGVIGLVGLELYGATVALVAMLLAAVYPVLIEESGLMVAENVMVPLMLAAVWAAVRAGRSAHPVRWGALAGLFTGLATLTHENAILLLLPLGVAVASAARPWRGLRPARGPALTAVVSLVAMAALAISPWAIRNAVELHRFVPVSDETGITLRGTYNPASAADPTIPYKWRLFSHDAQDDYYKHHGSRFTEPQLSDALQSRALHYIGRHPLSPLAVIVDNTLRMLELEGSAAWHASAIGMGLSVGTAHTGVIAFWVMAVLALLGLLTPRAWRAPRWLWGVPVLLWLSAVAINMETPRFREPIEPFLILLAACAVTSAVAALGGRRVPAGTESGLGGAPVGRRRNAPGLARARQLVEVREGVA
jgi:hypothetical protein